MSAEDVEDTAAYTAPRRIVALCYQPSNLGSDGGVPLQLEAGCQRLAVQGSAGGLVVLKPDPADPLCSVSCLGDVLGLASANSNAEPGVAPICPAAAYPTRYDGLRVHVLTTTSTALESLQRLLSAATVAGLAGHICAPVELLPVDEATGTVHIVQHILDSAPPSGASSPNVFIIHLHNDRTAQPSTSPESAALFVPPSLDAAVDALLDLLYTPCEGVPSQYSDVHLAVVRLQPRSHTPTVPASSPLSALIPRQSYQLAIPSASSSTPSYLPILSYHPESTRSDRALHSTPPLAFSVGSGGLIAARDGLAELAFKLGGKAKYGA